MFSSNRYFNDNSIEHLLPFEFTSEYKYLGIIIDSKLQFANQYACLIHRLQRYFFIFSKLSIYVNKSTLSSIFLTYVLPIIEYAFISYLFFNKQNYFRIKNKLKKLIPFTNLDPSLYDIDHRLKYYMLKFFLTIYNKICPESLIFNFHNYNNTRRAINWPIISSYKYFFYTNHGLFTFWTFSYPIMLKTLNIPNVIWFIVSYIFQILTFSIY